jgi:hypothetical protein
MHSSGAFNYADSTSNLSFSNQINMNKIYLLSCLLLLAGALRAQKDTVFVSHSESSETLTPTVLTDARNEVFKMQDPCRFLLKLNLAPLLPVQSREITTYNGIFEDNTWDVQGLDLSGEFKLTPSLSIDAGVQATLRSQDNWFTSITARIEPRWYYGMARKIKNGKQADNLSGNYLSVEYAYSRYRNKSIGSRNSLLINWGAQRRLFNGGYFDLGFGAGVGTVASNQFSRGGRVFFARPRAAIGLAMASPRSEKSAGTYCDVLRCFVEERRMWKLDLFNLVDFYSDYRLRAVSLAPTIAFEQKIANSAWSVNTEIGGRYYNARYTIGLNDLKQYFYSQFYQASIALEPRWYFNLKRRIAEGKSGNSLSGMYAALQTRWAYSYDPAGNLQEDVARSIQHWSVAPVWGFQQRFMRNGYVDFNIGPGLASKKYTLRSENGDKLTLKRGGLFYLAGGLRVGLAF